MFFYLIHNLPWGKKIDAAKRNCTTFLIGVIFYVITITTLRYLGEMDDKLLQLIFYGFLVIMIADIGAMFYLYKHHYGRHFMHEFDEPSDWTFDKVRHKYTRKTNVEREFEDWKRNKEVEKKVEEFENENK